MLRQRKGVLLDGVGQELVRASLGGRRKTLSQWFGALGDAWVTATGGTTALTLAARYGRMLTPEDFGAVGDGATNDYTALAAWLACGDKYLCARGTYATGTMLTIPADTCVDAMGASFTPTGNIDVIRMHGAAKLLGYPHIDVSGVGGWNSAALLFDGSSYAVAANQFLLYRPTIAQVRLTGVTTGTGNGVGVYFKTVDDTVNNQWIQGVVVHAIGRGFDKALYMVKDGASGTRTFVNSNTVVMEWGAPYQSVVLESDHASSYGVDGNKIFFRTQSRDSSEQNAVPVVVVGQYNEIEGVQWDWVGGGGGTTNVMTIAAGARGNRIKGPFDPALVTNSSTETNNTIDNTYLSGSGALFIGDLRPVVTGGAIQVGATIRPIANDGAALGTTALSFSDLFLASGAVQNWNNGDVTLTHSANTLTWAGASSGYVFDAPLMLPSTGSINFNSGDVTLTHSSNQLAGAGGKLTWTNNVGAATESTATLNTTDNASVLVSTFEGDRTVGSVANNDTAYIEYRLSDSGGAQHPAARTLWRLTNVTDTTEEGDYTIAVSVAGTITNKLRLSGTALAPVANDGLALGTATLSYADLFLATGGVVNWNNGDVLITHSANQLAFTGASTSYTFDSLVSTTASMTAHSGTAIPAGGTAGAGLQVSSTANFGVYFGSGAPTLSAAQGSLYLRSDGSTTTTRMYVNTNGSTTWTAVTTVA